MTIYITGLSADQRSGLEQMYRNQGDKVSEVDRAPDATAQDSTIDRTINGKQVKLLLVDDLPPTGLDPCVILRNWNIAQ
jgi:hypothetical protein